MFSGKVVGVEEYRETTNGYGMTPWTIRMHVVFTLDGKRRLYARLDHVLRQWLGPMTETCREAVRNTSPETVSVFSKKYENPYSSSDKRTIYTVRKGELEAWAKRAKALLPSPPEVVKVEHNDAPTLSKAEVDSILERNGEIPTGTVGRPLCPPPPPWFKKR